MFVENLLDRADASGPFGPDVLHLSENLKVPLIALGPGQAIPPHPGEEGVFVVLRGSGVATVGEGSEGSEENLLAEDSNGVFEFDVSEGSFWTVEAGQVRGLRAVDGELVALVAASLTQ